MEKKVVVVYYRTEETGLIEIVCLSMRGDVLQKMEISRWANGPEKCSFDIDLIPRSDNFLNDVVASVDIGDWGKWYDKSFVESFMKEQIEDYFQKWEITKIHEI